jgi:hypothetical protein
MFKWTVPRSDASRLTEGTATHTLSRTHVYTLAQLVIHLQHCSINFRLMMGSLTERNESPLQKLYNKSTDLYAVTQ